MKYRIYFLFILAGLAIQKPVCAQYSSDLRINEVQAVNTDGIQDQYGEYVPWVEIFNTAYNSINMQGLFLSNNRQNLTLYKLPTDARFSIPQRGYIVFYCDGNAGKSNYHTNFKLDSTGWVYLTDADGVSIIDSVQYSASKPNSSYARAEDGADKWINLDYGSPMQSNSPQKESTNAQTFVKYDPIGIGMSLIAMFVVMSALAISYLTFKYASRLYRSDLKKNKTIEKAVIENTIKDDEISGEVAAAIAASIHLYIHQMHDLEDTIITIQKISKAYSPWSSKLYMLRPWPHKNH